MLRAALGAGRSSAPDVAPRLSDTEWRRLLVDAEWHRLSAAIYELLVETSGIPSWVRSELEDCYLRQLARVTLVRGTARAAVDAIAEAGIPVVLLKGVALVETVYDDPATRDIGDVDMLVSPADFDAAAAALAAHGFRATERDAARCDVTALGLHHDVPVFIGAEIIPVELHHQIVNLDDQPLAVDTDALIARSAPSALAEHARLLAPEDALLHACVHFTHGRQSRSEGALAEVRDLVHIVDRLAVDWEAFHAAAKRHRLSGRVHLAAFTLCELGLIPTHAPMLARPPAGFDGRAARRYVTRRVLSSTGSVPVTEWRPSIAGVRAALWWSRKNLGSRHGLEAEATRPLLSRRSAFASLAGHVFRDPRAFAADIRIARWIKETT